MLEACPTKIDSVLAVLAVFDEISVRLRVRRGIESALRKISISLKINIEATRAGTLAKDDFACSRWRGCLAQLRMNARSLHAQNPIVCGDRCVFGESWRTR